MKKKTFCIQLLNHFISMTSTKTGIITLEVPSEYMGKDVITNKYMQRFEPVQDYDERKQRLLD